MRTLRVAMWSTAWIQAQCRFNHDLAPPSPHSRHGMISIQDGNGGPGASSAEAAHNARRLIASPDTASALHGYEVARALHQRSVWTGSTPKI